MPDAYDWLIAALDTINEDGDTLSFEASKEGGCIVLTNLEALTSFEKIEITLRSNGEYEVETKLTMKQRLFNQLRGRWSTFNDWDDDDLGQLLDELDVKY